jgi:hypothetical protein
MLGGNRSILVGLRMAATGMLASMLASCATPLKPEVAASIRTIGVISACGSTLALKHVGTIRFTNSDESAAIPEWGIDSVIVDGIRAALRERYDVRQVNYDPTAFGRDRIGGSSGATFISAAVRNHAKPADGASAYDAYVVVWPAERNDTIGNTSEQLPGIGVYDRNFLGIETTALYSSCWVTVVDGRSFKTLAEEYLRLTSLEGSEALSRILFNGAAQPSSTQPYFQIVDRTYWAEKFSDLTPAQKINIQAGLKQLVQSEIPATLRYLQLIQ